MVQLIRGEGGVHRELQEQRTELEGAGDLSGRHRRRALADARARHGPADEESEHALAPKEVAIPDIVYPTGQGQLGGWLLLEDAQPCYGWR